MYIYISAKWSNRIDLRDVVEEIEIRTDHKVISSWIEHDDENTARATAWRDFREVSTAHILILDTLEPLAADCGGGREWEFGVAFGLCRPVWRVGPIRSTFHHLVDEVFGDWSAVIEALEAI